MNPVLNVKALLLMLAVLMFAGCASNHRKEGGGQDLSNWIAENSKDPLAGLWHGEWDCGRGLSSSDVLLGIRAGKGSKYQGIVAAVLKSTRPKISSWRITGETNADGNILMQPTKVRRKAFEPLAYAMNILQPSE